MQVSVHETEEKLRNMKREESEKYSDPRRFISEVRTEIETLEKQLNDATSQSRANEAEISELAAFVRKLRTEMENNEDTSEYFRLDQEHQMLKKEYEAVAKAVDGMKDNPGYEQTKDSVMRQFALFNKALQIYYLRRKTGFE